MRISRAAFDAIVSHAGSDPASECCGILFFGDGIDRTAVAAALPALNIAADPARRFEIDPATLIRAHRAERGGGPRIAGCYHSHPGGDPTPSAQDAAQAEPNGALWLICAGPPWTITLWKAVPDGAVQGRFDPIGLIIDAPVETGDIPGL